MMTEPVIVLEEPLLEFADGHLAADPRDGLTLYGPYDAPSRTASQYVVVGTPLGAATWCGWARAANQAHSVVVGQDSRLWPLYPGYSAAFGVELPGPSRVYEIDARALDIATRQRDPFDRTYSVVNLYLKHIEAAARRDARPSLAICIVPDEVYRNCRIESQVANPIGPPISRAEVSSRRSGQMDLFNQFEREQYWLAPDFRRQLKARTMALDVPVQILRVSTLQLEEPTAGQRQLTPLCDRMWNIGTALHYKAGGRPWKLAGAREGVCYVGLAFRCTDARSNSRSACCAAQMFLDSGDGIVFLGEYGPWYSPANKQFHLSRTAARTLLEGVLTTYEQQRTPGTCALEEVFIHSRSRIGDEEMVGFMEAAPNGCRVVGVRIRPDGLGPRLYRDGKLPVLRGTFWQQSPRSGLLYGSGFKPRLGTYDGWETPVPLKVDIQHGDASLDIVARDVFALTKLNYNACRLGESQPVTVGFSDAVGEILISNPHAQPRPNFKYYI